MDGAAAAVQFAVLLLKSAQALDATVSGKSSEPVITMMKLGQIAEGQCDAFLDKFPNDSTPAVKDARIIAQQGKDVCSALSKKVAKMHPDKKNPKTLARALVTFMWSKEELVELQRSLSDCMQALGRFLSQQDRVMVETALKDSKTALASQINTKSEEILALHIKTSAQSDDRWSQTIQLANAENAKRTAQKKVKLLLDALAFPGMDQRYSVVSTAEEDTFRWIFGGQEDSDVGGRFSRWLTSGNDVFHIAGKPGSGKSTLMKYIYENPATSQMLKQWAAGKTLVQASCFFWKPGNELQRTRMGLMRTLLHGLIVDSHDVAKTLFPEVWDAAGTEEKVKISLSDAATQKAFQRLVDGDARLAEAGYRYCFFIDGLDEYGDANNTIVGLVRELVLMAQNGKGWLKICASSREYPEITEKLAADEAHRLTLQDLTRRDITALVNQRLQNAFPDDDISENWQLAMLRNEIIYRAEGVFLWVVLVLGIIDEEAEFKPVDELRDFVRALPEGLDAFFDTIIDRIEKRNRNRQKAAILFQYTLQTMNSGDYIFRDNDDDDDIEFTGIKSNHSLYFFPNYLFWYMFLLEHPTLRIGGGRDAVLVQYEQVQQRLQTKDALEARLSQTVKQIKRYCEGLLTVRFTSNWEEAQVVLTHRSIHEYMTTLLATRWKDLVSDFDAAGAYVRMLHACRMPADWHVDTQSCLHGYFLLQVAVGPDRFGTERLHQNFQLFDACVAREEEAGKIYLGGEYEIPFATSEAAIAYCHEYLDWRRHKPHAQQELVGKDCGWHLSQLCNSLVAGNRARDARILSTIGQLLASGVSVSEYIYVEVMFKVPWLAVAKNIFHRALEPMDMQVVYGQLLELFIQASDGPEVLPTWVWLDKETVLVVVDVQALPEKKASWAVEKPSSFEAGILRPADIPGTVSLAEMMVWRGFPDKLVALAEALEPPAARARRAEQLLSAKSMAQLKRIDDREVDYISLE